VPEELSLSQRHHSYACLEQRGREEWPLSDDGSDGRFGDSGLLLRYSYNLKLNLSYTSFSEIRRYPLTETPKLYYNSYRLCDILLFQELNVVLR
jgi:hypothetical protein